MQLETLWASEFMEDHEWFFFLGLTAEIWSSICAVVSRESSIHSCHSVDLAMKIMRKIVDLSMKNGDLAIKNGDLAIKNGDLAIKNGGSFHSYGTVYQKVHPCTSLAFPHPHDCFLLEASSLYHLVKLCVQSIFCISWLVPNMVT